MDEKTAPTVYQALKDPAGDVKSTQHRHDSMNKMRCEWKRQRMKCINYAADQESLLYQLRTCISWFKTFDNLEIKRQVHREWHGREIEEHVNEERAQGCLVLEESGRHDRDLGNTGLIPDKNSHKDKPRHQHPNARGCSGVRQDLGHAYRPNLLYSMLVHVKPCSIDASSAVD
jgi:hypothetical protein